MIDLINIKCLFCNYPQNVLFLVLSTASHCISGKSHSFQNIDVGRYVIAKTVSVLNLIQIFYLLIKMYERTSDKSDSNWKCNLSTTKAHGYKNLNGMVVSYPGDSELKS